MDFLVWKVFLTLLALNSVRVDFLSDKHFETGKNPLINLNYWY
jgi:hypothetical protein